MVETNERCCKNCGNTFTETFCNKCGQKEAHRMTTPHVAHELVHVFVHADKGVFAFMSMVVFSPGAIARNFVDGKRKIFNPFQYLIFAVSIILFLMTRSQFYAELESYSMNSTSALPVHFRGAMQDYNKFVKEQASLITFFTIPIYALFSWRFFKKREHNYAEHFTLIVFAMCQAYTLNIIVLLGLIIFNVSSLSTASFSLLLMVVSFSVSYKQFYSLHWLTAIWKGVAVFITAYFLQVLILTIGLLIYVFTITK